MRLATSSITCEVTSIVLTSWTASAERVPGAEVATAPFRAIARVVANVRCWTLTVPMAYGAPSVSLEGSFVGFEETETRPGGCDRAAVRFLAGGVQNAESSARRPGDHRRGPIAGWSM